MINPSLSRKKDSKSPNASEEYILSSAIHDSEASFSTDMPNVKAAHKFEVSTFPHFSRL